MYEAMKMNRQPIRGFMPGLEVPMWVPGATTVRDVAEAADPSGMKMSALGLSQITALRIMKGHGDAVLAFLAGRGLLEDQVAIQPPYSWGAVAYHFLSEAMLAWCEETAEYLSRKMETETQDLSMNNPTSRTTLAIRAAGSMDMQELQERVQRQMEAEFSEMDDGEFREEWFCFEWDARDCDALGLPASKFAGG